jgi:hypothetical protein
VYTFRAGRNEVRAGDQSKNRQAFGINLRPACADEVRTPIFAAAHFGCSWPQLCHHQHQVGAAAIGDKLPSAAMEHDG